jgi:hypothetical protein
MLSKRKFVHMIILMTMDRFVRRYVQVFQEHLDEENVERKALGTFEIFNKCKNCVN